ncbi:MAG: cysteine desulfurase [Clostridiales bacterium]|jgi:cysteine desulfurase|nr:cysteine desulfurase family protein [Oscillospiraceae bacterium]PWL92248.1 MAG: cysteine desulfurase [Clostridiales bacterium]
MTAYLDNAATTPVCREAAEAALRVMTEGFGNPSAQYSLGQQARKQLEGDRKTVAAALGCQPREVVFTSCGTESDNWALRLGAERNRHKGRHIITTAIEHGAILQTCRQLEAEGWEVTYLPPNREGTVSLSDLEAALRPETALVSMMLVNNEVGTVLPVREAAALVKRYDRRILFHTDAVQGFLKLPFTPAQLGVDLLSLSGHKVHAPKGIGALYIRSGVPLKPLILGGGQENGLRSGTEPTAQIAAFAAACQAGRAQLSDTIAHLKALKAYTLEQLRARVPEAEQIGRGEAPHILALTLPGYKSEVLVRVLGDQGVYISAGSACHRGKSSHVYEALSLSKPQRNGAFRVSFDRTTAREEVDAFVAALARARDTLFPSMS